MPSLACVASAEGLLSRYNRKLLLPRWDRPARVTVTQHAPAKLYTVSCVTSSNPHVPTALHPRLCRWQLPVFKLPPHVRGRCLLHSALDERVPLLLSSLIHHGNVDVVHRRNTEQAVVRSRTTEIRQIVPEPCFPPDVSFFLFVAINPLRDSLKITEHVC